jgi:hypothetical protein
MQSTELRGIVGSTSRQSPGSILTVTKASQCRGGDDEALGRFGEKLLRDLGEALLAKLQ